MMPAITPQSLAAQASGSCRIVVVNDVLGTRTDYQSPQSVADAMKDHGEVAIAKEWAEYEPFVSHDGDEPIAVAIRKTADAIAIHWHVIGDDIEAARCAMRRVLAGEGRCGL